MTETNNAKGVPDDITSAFPAGAKAYAEAAGCRVTISFFGEGAETAVIDISPFGEAIIDGTSYRLDTIRDALRSLDQSNPAPVPDARPENHGPYRAISFEEWEKLGGPGNPRCDWHEGVGYVVYDEQAREEYRAKVASTSAPVPAPVPGVYCPDQVKSAPVDPAPVSRVFPVPLTVESNHIATFIMEGTKAVACLCGEDHHERALAFVAAVQPESSK